MLLKKYLKMHNWQNLHESETEGQVRVAADNRDGFDEEGETDWTLDFFVHQLFELLSFYFRLQVLS